MVVETLLEKEFVYKILQRLRIDCYDHILITDQFSQHKMKQIAYKLNSSLNNIIYVGKNRRFSKFSGIQQIQHANPLEKFIKNDKRLQSFLTNQSFSLQSSFLAIMLF